MRKYNGRKKGFTLRVFLSAIILIAILVLIVWPKYKLLVAKSQVLTYMPMIQTIAQAQEAYHEKNGKYVADLRELDVNLEGCTMDESYPFSGNQYRCGNTILIDNAIVSNQLADTTPRGWVAITYCPHANTNFDTCRLRRHAIISNYYQRNQSLYNSGAEYAGKKTCWYYTSFGEKLCASLAGVLDAYGLAR